MWRPGIRQWNTRNPGDINYWSQSVLTRATGNTLILPVVTLVTLNMNTHGYPWNLNPFLVCEDDDNSVSSAGSFFSANSPPSYAPPPLPPRAPVNLKLLVFCTDAPVAWFAAVEAQFKLAR